MAGVSETIRAGSASISTSVPSSSVTVTGKAAGTGVPGVAGGADGGADAAGEAVTAPVDGAATDGGAAEALHAARSSASTPTAGPRT